MSLSGDLFTIPSPFDFPKESVDEDEEFERFGTKNSRGDGTSRQKRQRKTDKPDRRIPLINFTNVDTKDSALKQGAVFVDDKLDPHRDLQYLGECMVRKSSSQPMVSSG